MKRPVLTAAFIALVGQIVSFCTLISTTNQQMLNLSTITFSVCGILGMLTLMIEEKSVK